MFEFAVDGVYGEYCVFADIGMTMFEAGAACGDEGFEEFGVLGDFLEKAESCAADVFIGVLLKAYQDQRL